MKIKMPQWPTWPPVTHQRERFTTFNIAVELLPLPCGLDVDQSTSVGGTSTTLAAPDGDHCRARSERTELAVDGYGSEGDTPAGDRSAEAPEPTAPPTNLLVTKSVLSHLLA